MDELRNLPNGRYLPEGRPFARVLYQLWTMLCVAIPAGHQLVFAGKSATLFTLGRGFYTEAGLMGDSMEDSMEGNKSSMEAKEGSMEESSFKSPKGHKCIWILLDALARKHVKAKLQNELPDFDVTEQVVDEVELATGGIPRYVVFARQFICTRKFKENKSLHKDFVDYMMEEGDRRRHVEFWKEVYTVQSPFLVCKIFTSQEILAHSAFSRNYTFYCWILPWLESP